MAATSLESYEISDTYLLSRLHMLCLELEDEHMHGLPETVAPFTGRITDADSHEMMPIQFWIDAFGEVARPWVKVMGAVKTRNANSVNIPDYAGDVAELDPETVWVAKGVKAPGAVDMNRRDEVMDTIGVSRQLMFPSGPGLYGMTVYGSPKEGVNYGIARFGISEDNLYSHACDLMRANNDWAVEVARISQRCRPVTGIYGGSPDELYSVTKSLIDRGIRAVQICAGRLPGGASPASNDLDPFYAMLAEADVALTLHIGGEPMFFHTTEWNKARAFEGFRTTAEGNGSPWYLSTFHLPPQNFIGTMVAGGVFDRHPTLRVGSMEYSAHWIGPLARMLDLWHENNQSLHPQLFADGTEGRRLPMRPSEYISRNVRVTPFDFEPVGEYIQMYGMEDVYCFASDYPHVEGGKKAVDKFAASLEPLGPRVMEKFFVTNGELLMPP